MAVKRRQQMSENSLSRLAERDRGQFYALAAEYGLRPGPGKKISYLIKRIMEASEADVAGGEKSAPPVAPARRQRPKKAVQRPQVASDGWTAEEIPQILSAELEQNTELLRNFILTLGKSLIEAAESLNR